MSTKLGRIARWIIGGLFAYAGVAKMLSLSPFAAQLEKFGFGSGPLVDWLAHFLPALEIMCGVCLASGFFKRGSLVLIASMLVGFQIVLGHAWRVGIQADCGCFGKLFGSASIPGAFVRNIGLLGVLALIVWWERQTLESNRS